MSESRTSLSGSRSYLEIGEYWDQHELSDHAPPEEFEVDLRSSSIYFPLERALAEKVQSAASAHGVSAETLLNLWIQERVAEESRKADPPANSR